MPESIDPQWIHLQQARWRMMPGVLRDAIDQAIYDAFGEPEVPGLDKGSCSVHERDALRQHADELALLLEEAKKEWGQPWHRVNRNDDARHVHIHVVLKRHQRLTQHA